MKKLIAIALLLLMPAMAWSQKKEIHILSANDMHAALDRFPQLADIADSLRALYPQLLVFSAGDNRTGDPLNDRYEIAAYPMVALMNQVGFNASTLGNHEFDSNPQGLAKLIDLSHFRHICANIQPDPQIGIHCIPCQVFDVEGTKVGVVGVVQLGIHGRPDTHPDNVTGINFSPVNETVEKYKWLREQCDVVILLSHIGYDADVEISKDIPWVDLIIGGHSHTQLEGGEIHNGILITQNANKLGKVTHTTLTVENGKVTAKKAENINVKTWPKKNKVVENMVKFFSENNDFGRVLTQAATPFGTYEELGCLMSDAFRAEGHADIGVMNYGGVRYDILPAGNITVNDVLQLDPFGNDAVELNLTGKELRDMLIACSRADEDRFPIVSGITCEVTRDKNDSTNIKSLQLFTPDGKKLNLKKTYKVVTNSYTTIVSDSPRKDQGRSMNYQTSDMIINFLTKQPSVSYQGERRIKEMKK
ncbi:MAG: bifunctional metallophosphatase/5'-nucleotidase [Prevotella sp.]|nr:bifunctional metallophosphatase/5'-nucleotidase [Prevotella sp.]